MNRAYDQSAWVVFVAIAVAVLCVPLAVATAQAQQAPFPAVGPGAGQSADDVQPAQAHPGQTGPVGLLPDESRPVSSRPAESAPVPAPGEDLPEALVPLANALRLTEHEKDLLSGVVDHAEFMDRADPMFMMLSHLERVPALSGGQFDLLQRVPTKILRRYPADFRGDAMHVSMLVRRVSPMTPGRDLPQSSYWDPRKLLYLLVGVDATAPTPSEEPLVVLSIVDPRETLGEPVKVESNGTHAYQENGRRIELACVFYKLMREPEGKNPNRDFPVLLAWEVRPPAGSLSASSVLQSPGMLATAGFVLLVVLGVVWFMVRAGRSVRRMSAAGPYRRMRERRSYEPEPSEPVDPALRQAVEEYEKERQAKNERPGKG